jgi:hypothetical protein
MLVATTWQHLAAPPRTQGHPFNIHPLKDGSLVCTYSGRRAGNPHEFTASSGVFFSSQGGIKVFRQLTGLQNICRQFSQF